MNKNITKISIERPVFTWMLMASLIIFGMVSFKFLGVSNLPDVDFPVINVSVDYEGASPEVIESDVIDIIENGLMGAEGLTNISSTARYGRANITLEFDIDRDVGLALQDVQSKLAQTQRRLPKDVDAPLATKQNPEDQPILWISFSGPLAARDLMLYARDKIIPQFQLVPGVGDVFLGGYIEPNVRIWVNAKKLARYELSIEDVIDAIGREHIERPAGLLQEGDTEYTLRVVGEARSAKEVEAIMISRRGGAPIYSPIQIRDVARVEVGLEDVRRVSRVMREPAVGIGIRKQSGTNAVSVADAAKAKMQELQMSLPSDLKLGVNFDRTRFIKESIHDLQFELLLAALLTGLVCWLFLGSFQSTLNVLLAIPTSLIGSFIAIKFFGFTLNSFTFLGLMLAVGIVVDDAIMVLENIIRHRQMKKSKVDAAQDGTDQIRFAAMATTFAIMAIFLPVAFMEGVIGKFFFQFGLTISVAIALSLLEALTLTPMRCSQFLEAEEKHGLLEPWVKKLANAYTTQLKKALQFRKSILLGATVFFALSLLLVIPLKKEFVPSQDQGSFMVRLTTKVGSSLDHTDRLAQEAEELLAKIPEIERFFLSVGGFGSGQVNTAIIFVTLKNHSERSRSQNEMMDVVRAELQKVKGLRATIQDLSTGGFGGGRGFPIEFSIRGPDWDKLVETSNKIANQMTKDLGFIDVDTNYDEGMPEVRIIPDRNRAAQLGISVDDIARSVSYLIGGSRIARYTEGGKRIDIRIQLDSDFRENPNSLLKIKLRNNRGELVSLDEVAKIEVKTTLVSITREARERAITVYSNISPQASQKNLIQIIEGFRKDLPQGYTINFGGSSKSFGESFGSLTFALLFGIIIAYMILASQFNSFIDGFTVLLSLPFSISGAFIALFLAGSSLNVYSMIGLILLMGIVKKNSIMLVDFANQQINAGLETNAAILAAANTRLRPILMTSITVVTASLPPVLGIGPGTETRSSMSLAVMGGVIISTFLTLYVVPCAHSLLADAKRTFIRKKN